MTVKKIIQYSSKGVTTDVDHSSTSFLLHQVLLVKDICKTTAQ